ncbi:hypothetical protein [Longispora urticae]
MAGLWLMAAVGTVALVGLSLWSMLPAAGGGTLDLFGDTDLMGDDDRAASLRAVLLEAPPWGNLWAPLVASAYAGCQVWLTGRRLRRPV